MNPPHERAPARSNARRIGLGLLLLAAIAVGFVAALRKGTSELPVYTIGAQRMVDGAEVFRPDDEKVFTYPPFFALPFVPFVWLPESAHRGVWYFVNVGVLALIVLALRRAALTWRPAAAREVWLWIPVVAIAGRHVAAVFQNQSHDLLVFACIVVAARAMQRGRDSLAGAACGIGTACKATPLLFLPMFVAQFRLRAALGLLLLAAGATLLPDLLFPRADGGSWVVAWYDTFFGSVQIGSPAHGSGAWTASAFLNQNLAGTIHRLSVPVPPEEVSEFARDVALWAPSAGLRRAVTLAGQLAVVAVIAFAAWPSRARKLSGAELGWRRVGECAAMVCGMVLLSPMSSKSHFGVLLLPAVFCVTEMLWRRFRWSTTLWLCLALALGTLTTKGILGRDLGNDVLAMGSVTWSAVAMLMATASLLWQRDRR